MSAIALPKKFGSLFSGAGGADLGLKRGGMRCVWTCEFDPRCQDVLRYHDPETPIYPDVRTFDPETAEVPDALWASPPCQDLSVAGKRGGLAGDRSGLFYEFIRIAKVLVRRGTRYLLMEQVPGLFSSNGGEDLRQALLAFLELGPVDLAWRVLDSQWFGVAQRRRRGFFVLDFGGERAGEILALLEGLSGHPKPSRTSREATPEGVAGCLGGGSGERGFPNSLDICGAFVAEASGFDPAQITNESNRATLREGLAPTLSATGTMSVTTLEVSPTLMAKSNLSLDPTMKAYVCSDVSPTLGAGANRTGGDRRPGSDVDTAESLVVCSEVAGTLMASGAGMDRPAGMPDEASYCVGVLGDVAHTLAAEGFDASEDGTGRGCPVVAFGWNKSAQASMTVDSDTAPTLQASHTSNPAVAYAISMRARGDDGRGYPRPDHVDAEVSPCLETVKTPVVAYAPEVGYTLRANPSASGDKGDGGINTSMVATRTRVRRLTPRECERLQGWPDDHTRYGRKVDGTVYEIADGPRYRMMGNGVTRTLSEVFARAIDDERPIPQVDRDRLEHSLAFLLDELDEDRRSKVAA